MRGYRDLAEIHRGGRYLVWRGRRTADAAPVVIKAVRPEGADPSEAASRLRREHALLLRLGLDGTPVPLELTELDQQPALVLADAGDESLETWVRRRTLEPAQFLELAIGLAELVGQLHERGVLHRDVNPANVVVGPDRRLTLVDFEGAAVATDVAGMSFAPALVGALPYAAPEQTGRMGCRCDQRADLYALGATYYRLLTGAPPFTTSDPLELVHAHLAETPRPPAQTNRAVPEALSAIVMKLLAKMPERRYQSAAALLADLREARERLARTGTIAPFELGVVDLVRELPLPETLYGRSEQRAALAAAWERAAAGQRVAVFLVGEAGAGKSALAQSLQEAVSRRGGHLITGKYDQQRGHAPYAPLLAALGALVRAVSERPAGEVEETLRRLHEGLGANVAVLTALVPELARLLGAQPAPPALGPSETEARFRLAFRALLETLATAEHPLALFIDDLQWADAGSLELLRLLATAPEVSHFLVIAALRPDEVGPEHPVRRLQRALDESGVRAPDVSLPPLGPDDVLAFCCDVFSTAAARVAPLSGLLWRKTAGNPFFLRRLLRHLHREGLVSYAVDRWTWELARIEEVGVSDNVVTLLLTTLRRLPPDAQQLLTLAACAGRGSEEALLAAVLGRDLAAVEAAIVPAVQEGLVARRATEHGTAVSFVHDRVQQAAASLVDERARAALHLAIGRELASGPAAEVEARLFAVVDHLGAAAALIDDPEERLRVAELHLRAARRARSSSAHAAALAYLRGGIALLPPDVWEAHHELALALHRDGAECGYVAGEPTEAEALWRTAVDHARPPEQVALHELRVVACISRGDQDGALHWGQEGLRLLGVELPLSDLGPATAAELAAVQRSLAGRTPEEVLEGPVMQDPTQLACVRLLSQMTGAAFLGRQELFPLLVARIVNLSLVHGNAVPSALAYVFYAVILIRRTGDYALAHRFGRLGVELGRRMGDPGQECRATAVYFSNVYAWRDPIEVAGPFLRRGLERGLEAGEVLFGVSCPANLIGLDYHRGVALPRLHDDAEAGLLLSRRTNTTPSLNMFLIYRQVVRCLMGLTRGRCRLDDDDFDDRAFLAGLGANVIYSSLYEIRRLELAYLFGDLPLARQMAEAAGRHLAFARQSVQIVEHNFYTSLTAAALCAGAPADEQPALRQTVVENQRQLGRWAEVCPENYRHKHLLVEAELAQLEGRTVEAVGLFEQAIDAAARAGFLQDEALAYERAGRCHRTLGWRRTAQMLLGRARDAYQRWGARAKCEALDEEFPDLATAARRTSSAPGDTESLDVLTLLRAAETIAGEVVLERLLGRLIDVCLAAAGAQRAGLVLEEEGGAFVRALGSVAEGPQLHRTPLAETRELPRAIVERVRVTGEPVVLADAGAQGDFRADPFVAAQGVRSVLALPIHRQAKLVGVLYLENDLAARVFTPDRVGVLQLLSSQMAISLENSLLIDRLVREIEERKRAEGQVRFLAEAGLALSGSLDYHATLTQVARLGVSGLADWCGMDLLEGGQIRRAVVAHRDPAREPLLRELRRLQDERDSPLLYTREVMASGKPLLFSDVTPEVIAHYMPDADQRALLAQVGVRSGMVLPLCGRDGMLGSMMFVSAAPDRRYDAGDLALAEELARRAATAIDNARLYGEARQAIRLRDEFLQTASHELNTPTAALLLTIDGLLSAHITSDETTARHLLELADRQGRRLAKLIGELLDATSVDRGTLALQFQRTELNEIVRRIVAEQEPELRRARCEVALAPGAPIVGDWDPRRIEQIVASLLSNAVKFGPGRPIELRTGQSDGRGWLTVTDHGLGIEPGQQAGIFAKFVRGVSAAHYGGLGLGLFISKRIAELHQGTLSVESAPGSGTTFRLELPCRPAAGAAVS